MREVYHTASEVRMWLGQGSEDGTRCLKFIDDLTGAYIATDDPTGTEDSVIEETVVKALLVPGGIFARAGIRFGQALIDIGDIIEPSARDDKAEMLLDPDENYSLHQESIEDISEWRPSKSRLQRVQGENLREIAELFGKIFI
ncbi:hypothetical protein BZG36_05216 [Bifiguratus adelaidae]|uniref:Uncharacterized protein n=1 Tax=Bifiguratus adelaidae TaxID=1938954 RepID=A0A261XWX0_9FUNG|nr:hypothetical protein BZG36_05216 [Bifiguratus adelaidae]